MIPAIAWVPAGVADPNPKKYEFSAVELELIEMMEKQNLEGGETAEETELPTKDNSGSKKSKKEKTKIENTLPADLRMDEYSSDEDENDAVQGTTIGNLLVEDPTAEAEMMQDEEEAIEMFRRARKASANGMDSDDSGDEDDDLEDVPDTREYTPLDVDGFNSLGLSQIGTNAPSYMETPGEDEEEDDGSEAEDVQIHPDDAIVVVAKTEDDFASLEVHVYEQQTGNLFVHHDIPLPAFPLCLAHGDVSPSGSAGNFCAVGTFSPGIEIWNLDVLNALDPSCVLGGEDTSIADEIMRHNILNAGKGAKTKPKFNSKPSLRSGSHTDAVMSLSWNKIHRQVIASGSADCTVKLWDVTQANSEHCNAATLTHHKDKVQSVLWHPKEGTLLATGSYDRTVAIIDARSPENVKRAKIPADCEALAWDPFQPQYLTAASEDGTLTCWDVRKFSEKTPLWSIVASEYGGVSDLSYNPCVPGMLATCSVDKTVTLWDTHNSKEGKVEPPRACGSKDMEVGKLYTIGFYPSSPWLMGCAGGGKELALWDMAREDAIQKRFGDRVHGNSAVETETTNETTKQEDFSAMMTSEPASEPKGESPSKADQSKSKKKGGSNKKKKKAHKAGR